MTDSLAAALAELQATPPRIKKTARGQHGNYADLPTVMQALRPRLDKLGLLWTTAAMLTDSGQFVVRWSLEHLPTGDAIKGDYPIHATNPQQIGSEITYARRYALVTVTGITPEGDDDDGHAASQEPRIQPGRTRTRIPGPDHERLRQGTAQGRVDGAERRAGPDPDDPWAAEGNAEPAEKQPGSILPQQRTRIMQLFQGTHRDQRLFDIERITGHRVESVNDLSAEEAGLVIAARQS